MANKKINRRHRPDHFDACFKELRPGCIDIPKSALSGELTFLSSKSRKNLCCVFDHWTAMPPHNHTSSAADFYDKKTAAQHQRVFCFLRTKFFTTRAEQARIPNTARPALFLFTTLTSCSSSSSSTPPPSPSASTAFFS